MTGVPGKGIARLTGNDVDAGTAGVGSPDWLSHSACAAVNAARPSPAASSSRSASGSEMRTCASATQYSANAPPVSSSTPYQHCFIVSGKEKRSESGIGADAVHKPRDALAYETHPRRHFCADGLDAPRKVVPNDDALRAPEGVFHVCIEIIIYLFKSML
jgi:hypothetical protein